MNFFRKNDPDLEFINVYEEILGTVKRIFTVPEQSYIRIRKDISDFIYCKYGLSLEGNIVLFRYMQHLNNISTHIILLDPKDDPEGLIDKATIDYFFGNGGLELICIIPYSYTSNKENKATILMRFTTIFDAFYKILLKQIPDSDLSIFLKRYASTYTASQLMVDVHFCTVDELPLTLLNKERSDWNLLFELDFSTRMINQIKLDTL